jgi:CheY-like chemotaxis protein
MNEKEIWRIKMLLFIISLIIFIIADVFIRFAIDRTNKKKRQKERENALHISLKADYALESKTLKRAEVENPRAKILCVDDEPIILDSFRKILVLDGYSVDTVETGQEVLGLIQKYSYDFVFTDLKMPHMNGLDVTKNVKHLRPDIDVVIITGFATVETAVECMKYGAMDYVQKPFTEEELLEFTKKLLFRREEKIKNIIKPQVHITSIADLFGFQSQEFAIPGGVFISHGHCWAAIEQDGKVKVGIDDFANKLIGKISRIDFPNLGMEVKKEQVLFSVQDGNKNAAFKSPVSGKVVKINNILNGNLDQLEMTPYHDNWFCILDSDNLDDELRNLEIGKSAVDYYQQELEKLKSLHKKLRAGNDKDDYKPESVVEIGEMSALDNNGWNRYLKEFFN